MTPTDDLETLRTALRCGQQGCSCARRDGTVHCPAHDDHDPSLAVAVGADGKILVHCHAGCDQERVIAALRERGMWSAGVQAGATGCTLADLARAKRLPEAYLRQLGLYNLRYRGLPTVAIPYYDDNGREVAVRYRRALTGAERFAWRRGAHVLPYGLQRLDEARRDGWLLLVEGESDCWTAWHYGLPALGVPGKSTWRDAWAIHLTGLEVYLWREPDAPELPARIAQGVPGLRVIPAPDGIKDISDAHARGDDVPALIARLKAEAIPAERIKQQEAEAHLAELASLAAPALDAPDPLALVASELRRIGYGGDLTPALVVYLCATSRLLEMQPGAMPGHLLLVGPPSAGKSYTLHTVLRLLPPEAYHVINAGSPRVLIYDDADLRHRVVIFAEADSLPGGEDNPAASAIRNLAQDHRLHYQVVVRNPETGDFVVREVDKPGPTVLFTTSVHTLGGQLGSRLFTLPVPEDVERIRQVLLTQADLELEGEVECNPALVALQVYLQHLTPMRVVVPFATELAQVIGKSANAPRILRDFQRLLALIKAVAILRHRHRQHAPDGRLMATLEDYKVVRDLVGPMYEATVNEVTEDMRRAVETVRALRSEGVKATYNAVAGRIGIHREQVRRMVQKALKNEWLINHEHRSGYPADLDVGEPLPERVGLPLPDDLLVGGISISIGNPCDTVTSGVEARDTGVSQDVIRSVTLSQGSPMGIHTPAAPDKVTDNADDADDADGPAPTVRGEAGDEENAASPPPPPKCWRCGRPLTLGQRCECYGCSVRAYEIHSLPVPGWLERLAAQEMEATPWPQQKGG